jgi:MYXO-CTERM domain-containing protein
MNRWVGLLLALVASPVLAGSDTFFLGTGRDGVLVVSQPDTRLNRYAQVKAPLATGDLSVQVDSAEGFVVGDLVMVLQTTGLVPAAVPGQVAPLDLRHDAVGRWELARLASVDGDVLSLTSSLVSSYAAEVSQIIRVPEFTSVHVQPGASLVAQPWNGATGGVLAFLATGTLLNEGLIDVSGMGFRGGNPTWEETGCSSAGSTGEGVDSTAHGRASGPENVANGGGGGTCRGRAGGGGGNASAGGQAGRQPWRAGGMGGAPLVYSLLDHLILGGGGGGGYVRGEGVENEARGGRGGGAIFIRAGALDGHGAIRASGETGGFSVSEGPGGAGAGGSILVRLAGPMRCGGLHADGERGGASLGSSELVSGGGGGGGRVLYQAVSVTDCPAFARSWSSDAWSDVPAATSPEDSVTVLPGGFLQPEAATILWPGNGATVDEARPTILGRATSGMEIIVYLDGAEAGRVFAQGGLFSFSPERSLSEGKHTVQVESSYQGTQGGRSSLHAFVINRLSGSSGDGSQTLAPKPTLISIAGRSVPSTTEAAPLIVGTRRPLFVGESQPDQTVQLKLSRREGNDWDLKLTYDAVAVDTDCGLFESCRWQWNVTPHLELRLDAVYMAVVSVGGDSNTYYFKVDQTPPLPPSVTAPAEGQTIIDDTPTISGSFAQAGKVLISVDGEQRGEMSVSSAGGSWTFTWPDELSDGDHSVQVVGVNEAGIASSPKIVHFKVDTTAPPTPTVTSLGNVAVVNSTTTVRSKGPEPGSKVEIKNGTSTVGTAVAGTDGAWSATLGALTPDNLSTLLVFAKDSLDNRNNTPFQVKYYLDTTAPALAVTTVGNKTAGTSGSSLDINLNQPAITGTLNEPGRVSVTLTRADDPSDTQTLVAASPDGFTGTWNWSVVATKALTNAKSYNLVVNAFDTVGNPVSKSYVVNVDTLPPTTTIISCPASTGAPAPYHFEFGVDDDSLADMSFRCSLDGVAVTCSNTYSLSSATETDHLLLAQAVDKAGNVDATPVACAWTVSNAAFTIFIREAPAKLSNSPDAIFRLETNRATPSFTCQLKKDGATAPPFTACVFTAGKIEYRNLSEGSYALNVRASAGNESANGSWTWLVDKTPPAPVTISTPARDDLYLSTATTALEGSGRALQTDRDGEKFYVQIYVDSTPDSNPSPLEFPLPADKKWSYVLPRLDDGAHEVLVYIRDEANNRSTESRRDFILDTVPPETTISSSLPGRLTNAPSATFSFSSPTDAAFVVYECNLDDLGFELCNGTESLSHTVGVFTGDKTHTLQVRAKDRAGNHDPSPVQFAWRVDTVPPETFIESGPRPLTNEQSASFVLKSESGASFQCSLDGAAFMACPAEPYTGLGHGPHVLLVQAQDEATNVDASPAEHKWSVDLLPPDAPGISWPEANTVLSKAFPEVRGTAEANSTVDVFLGDMLVGSATTNQQGTWKVALELEVSDGRYDLVAWGTDVAGNKSSVSAIRTVMVDATAPDTSIVEGPSGKIRAPHASFQFSASEDDSTFECSLDFSEFEPCGATVEYDVPSGEHTLRVRALDRVKNPDPSPASRVWQVYLGGDSKAIGGGLSCSTTTGGSPVLAALGLLGLVALSARRTRR